MREHFTRWLTMEELRRFQAGERRLRERPPMVLPVNSLDWSGLNSSDPRWSEDRWIAGSLDRCISEYHCIPA